MGKHTAAEDLQAKADEFDRCHADSVARAEANVPTRDERIEQLKSSNGEHYRLYRRNAR